MSEVRDAMIAETVPSKSFLDVGGLWGGVNEKVTVAKAYGASALSMLDIWGPDDDWWKVFHQRCADAGLDNVFEVCGSVDSAYTVSAIGRHQVVHCSGVLYHCPNPLHTLRSLHAIAQETLIVAVAVMPSEVSNEHGVARLSDESAIFVPSINEASRKIYSKYISECYGGGAWGVNDPVSEWYFADGSPNYGPWWWLWTSGYFHTLLTTAGFRVDADYPQYSGTGHVYKCTRVESGQVNYGVYLCRRLISTRPLSAFPHASSPRNSPV